MLNELLFIKTLFHSVVNERDGKNRIDFSIDQFFS